MTASENYITIGTDLKIMTPVAEPAMHAIPGRELEKSGLVNMGEVKAPAQIFSISYTYNGDVCRTQAMQIGTDEYAFYKVVLCSKVSGLNNLCWLQKKEGQWTTLLGNDISNDLLHAIADAIENR